MAKVNLKDRLLKQIDKVLVYSDSTRLLDNGKNKRYISYSANNLKRIIVTPVAIFAEYYTSFNRVPSNPIGYTKLGCNMFFEALKNFVGIEEDTMNPNKMRSLIEYVFNSRAYGMLEEIVFIKQVNVNVGGRMMQYSFMSSSPKDNMILSNQGYLYKTLFSKIPKAVNYTEKEFKENYPRLRGIYVIPYINLTSDTDFNIIINQMRETTSNGSTLFDISKVGNLLPYNNVDYQVNDFRLTPLHYEIDIIPEKGSSSESLYTYFDKLRRLELERRKQSRIDGIKSDRLQGIKEQVSQAYKLYEVVYHARYKLAKALNLSKLGTWVVDLEDLKPLSKVYRAETYIPSDSDIRFNDKIVNNKELEDEEEGYKNSLRNLKEVTSDLSEEVLNTYKSIILGLRDMYPIYYRHLCRPLNNFTEENVPDICYMLANNFLIEKGNGIEKREYYVKGGK